MDIAALEPQMSPDNRAGMYSVASIKACECRTIDCFDVPLNRRIGSG
jgi:hypothetical protein